MKKLIFFFVLATFISEIAVAQKEWNNWFFGNNAGVTFNAGAPTFLPGGQVVSNAGSSSVSDNLGNLLFYSDGITVWNKNHQPMPNGTGLLGNVGGSQTVLITYYPGNKNLYFIFTVDKGGGTNRFRYSVVDMTLNGGLGDVDISQKNIDFNLQVSEKVTAIKSKNGTDLWLIFHAYNSNAFFVYSIDCKGNFYPHVYNIGSVISTPGNTRGYLKASTDGKKIVSANFEGNFEMFDFDNATGAISNFQVLPASSGNACGPYGVEFSPDSKLLYTSEQFTCTPSPGYAISQYRLDPSIGNTIASKVSLDAGTANLAGALQLGPDNKIYVAYDGSGNLGVINNANTYGTGASLVKTGPSVAPATSSFGLSNVIAGFYRNTLQEDTTVCDGAPFSIKLNLLQTTYLWSDGSIADSLKITTPGKYWVDLMTTNANGNVCKISDTINVAFQSAPKFSIGNDTFLCNDNFPLILSASPTIPAATYLWQDGSVKASYPASDSGNYWLQVTANGCSARDSIKISSATGMPFYLGADTTICAGDSLKLKANLTATSYLWSTGSIANTINADTAGIYWCEAKYANGCSYRDSIHISVHQLPVFSLGKDTILCAGSFPLLLNKTIANATYLWQDSSTAGTYAITDTGSYWLRATVNGCSARDTINVKAYPITPFELGADTVVCSNNAFVLTVTPAFATYLWSNGNTSNTISVTASGKYWCKATNAGGCTYSDTITITIKPIPKVDLGSDITICTSQLPYLLSQSIAGAAYLWQDGTTGNSFPVPAPGTYWVKATVNGCAASDTIVVKTNSTVSFNLGPDTSVCTNVSVVLTVTPAFTSYLWNTGSTARSISATTSGTYWCEASNGTGCSYRDSITLKINPKPVVDLGRDTTLCQYQLPFVLSQSIPGSTYLWQDGTTGNNITVSGSGKYWLRATLNGCSSADSLIVTANQATPFSLGADTVLCAGNSLFLSVNPAYSNYKWNTGSTARSISVNTSGTYWCDAVNSTGCTYRDSINVNFRPQPLLNLGNDTSVCSNAFPITIGNQVANATYFWQDGSSNANYVVLRPGTYWVQATVNGCSSRDSIVIKASQSSTFKLGPDTSVCSSTPLTLHANIAAASYLWNTGNTSPSISVTSTGDYWCEINNGTGCSSSDTIHVTFNTPIVFSLGNDTVICDNKTLLLDVSSVGNTYTWQDNSTQPQFLVAKPGIYSVKVTKGSCVKSDTIIVGYGSRLVPDLGPDKSICPGEVITLDAGVTASSYLWQDGSTNKTYKVTSPGTYSVKVINECGPASDNIIVSVGSCAIMVPNAFTPAKSTNNTFHVLNAPGLKNFNLQVFNRWGQQVFQAYQSSSGWDGRYNGQEQPSGVFIYILSYNDPVTGKKNTQKGTVVLIR
jgi:gliding motility-associated-like protein